MIRWLTHLGMAGALLLALACTATPADLADSADPSAAVDGAQLGEADGADPQGKPKSDSPKPETDTKKAPDKEADKKADDKKTGDKKPAKPKSSGRKPAAGGSKAEKALQEYKDERSLLEQEQASLAEEQLAIGKRKMQEQDWEAARKALQKAFDLDPSNAAAQKRLIDVETILGLRKGSVEGAMRRVTEMEAVEKQQNMVEIELLLKEARGLYKEGEFEKAIKVFEQAEAQITAGSAYLPNSGQLLVKVRKDIAESKRRKDQQELRNRERLSDAARKQAEHEEDRRRRRQVDKVNYLLDQAVEKMSANRFEKAIKLLDDVLSIEPQNQYAIALRKQAKQGHYLHLEWSALRKTKEYLLIDEENTDESSIPYIDFVRFPEQDKWLEVAQRVEGTGAVAAEEAPEVQRMREILNTRTVTINFEETPLDAVVNFLQDITGLNMQVSPQIDATDTTVTLSLQDALLVNALKLIMDKVGYSYTFRDEVIYIAEPGEEEGELIFDIYNVQDILNKIEDFSGPEIKVSSSDAPQPGQGGAGQLVFDDDDDEDLEGTIDPENLIDLITSSTGEDNWEREGASIEHHRGQLLVNNVREVHLEVQKVLQNLRKDAGLFVVVETRFVDLFDDFLMELGIDYRGLPTAPIGNSTGVMAPNQTGGVDPGAERTNGSATDNAMLRLQNIFDGFTGFLTGQRLTGGTQPGRDIPGLSLQSTWIEPFQVNAILRAREEKSRVQLLNAPVITAANRQRVFISAITQRAYISDYELGVRWYGVRGRRDRRPDRADL